MKEKPLILTAQKIEEMKARLKYLQETEKPQVLEALQLARSQGDLSENADYDAAKKHQGEIETEIAQLEHDISIAKVADANNSKNVSVTDYVTFKNLGNGNVSTVRVVSTKEIDPLAKPYAKISADSILGQALLGSSVDGKRITVEAVKPYDIEIISFSREEPKK